MGSELFDKIKKGLDSGKSPDMLKSELVDQGFIEDEVLDIIHEINGVERSAEDKRNVKIFTFKEVFDRVGYGFASVQFINILFSITGAGFFLIGLMNGLKNILSLLLSSFLQEYARVKPVSTKFMSKAGVLFGLSFLFIAMAVSIRSVPLFSVALLVGAVGVITYGDLYERLAEVHLKKEKLSRFLLNISHFGVIITGLAFLLSGILFDRFPMISATKVNFFGNMVPLYGYLICFEITAIAFILSGYVLHFVNEKVQKSGDSRGFARSYWVKVSGQLKLLFRSKHLTLLLIAGALTSLVQILGNSYYGIFIYKKFIAKTFQGLIPGMIFLNIAIIFLFALLVSFMGPALAKYLNKKVGLAPSLVFGTLLIAIMPLVCVYNPSFLPITVANALGVLGAAILGMGQGLLVRKLVHEIERPLYYAASSVGVVIPFAILIPLGAWIAQAFGLAVLFQLLALVSLGLAAPLFFILVIFANKQRL
ncbi:MFS transporter [Candidatus Woesearchaeota archaeon]|nr:MFS transporter [Candidatus Woesearchaeota archaeon]